MLTSQKSKSWVLLFAAYAVLQVVWTAWIFLPHLSHPLSLKAPLVALSGTLGAAWMIYRIVRIETQSRWWGLIGVGMFAASYRAMDSYFDVQHSDSWMLFLVLAGCSMLNYNRNAFGRSAGMLLLVLAFWCKQQAAVFAVGGLFFLLFQATAAECLLPGLLALVFGPILYAWMPASFLGMGLGPSDFNWDATTLATSEGIRNFAEPLARRWLMPTILTGAGLMSALKTGAFRSIWIFMVPVAFVTALLGMASSGPFETWLILISVIAIERLTRSLADYTLWPQIALAISFLALLNDPFSMVTAPDTRAAYGRPSIANTFSPSVQISKRPYSFEPTTRSGPS